MSIEENKAVVRRFLEGIFSQGNPEVATRWTVRGTHQGEMMGAAPTGKQVTFTGAQTDYISGGKMVESWSNWDTLGLLRQIGAVPAPDRQSGCTQARF